VKLDHVRPAKLKRGPGRSPKVKVARAPAARSAPITAPKDHIALRAALTDATAPMKAGDIATKAIDGGHRTTN